MRGMPDGEPQAILSEITEAGIFLALTVAEGAEDDVHDVLAEDKPSNSHLVLNTIVDENGDQRQVLRFNMPFGTVGVREFGTYFIAYAADPGVIEQMLDNMFVGDPPGNHDRILDFSTAATGNLYFVPTVDFLDDPPTAKPGDGSLAIGSLRDG
jgi:putative iron-dependent peroxidase